MNQNKTDERISIYHDSIKCNINIIVKLSRTIEDPKESDVLYFLYTFDESCRNNVEFSEFSNEILFEVIYRKPKLFLKLIENKNVNINLIFKNLEYPVNDKYDTQDIIKKIKIEVPNSEYKERVVKHLMK